MDPKALESAVAKLREQAKKVLVEYNSEDGVIIICVGRNPAETDGRQESLTVGTIREVKRKRFLDGHFFSLSEVSKKRRFKFVASENPTISDLVYEANNTHGGFDMYCEVDAITYEYVRFKLLFLNGTVIEHQVNFLDLNFFDV